MFTKREALEIVGGLSQPSKMPGWSWSIPAQLCKVGSTLRKIEGSTCSKCYAMKGNYTRFKAVQDAMMRRYQAAIGHKDWTEAMIVAISKCVKEHDPYFRWFDSGDLQNWEMFVNILTIAECTEDIYHWLPTRELRILGMLGTHRTISIPDNLVIRRSAMMIGAKPPAFNKLYPHTSGVAPKKLKNHWQELVDTNKPSHTYCPAPLQGNQCGSCRACWDPTVQHIVYLEH